MEKQLDTDGRAAGKAYSAAVVMERDAGRNLGHNLDTVRKCLADAKAIMDEGDRE